MNAGDGIPSGLARRLFSDPGPPGYLPRLTELAPLGDDGDDLLHTQFGRLLHDEVHLLALEQPLEKRDMEWRIGVAVHFFDKLDQYFPRGYACDLRRVSVPVVVVYQQSVARSAAQHGRKIFSLFSFDRNRA